MQKGYHGSKFIAFCSMNARVLSLWQVRVLATALALVGACALSLMMVTTVSAAAPSGFTSQTYQDVNGDGRIDTVVVVVNGSEALTACVVTDAEVATDWTYLGGATFGGSLATTGDTHTCVTGTATVTLKISSATANVTGGGTAPTIAYDNDDADNSIANASGNLGTVAAQTAADGAAPQIYRFDYSDNDGDAKVDMIDVTFTETVTAASVLRLADLTLTNDGDFDGLAFGSSTTDQVASSTGGVAFFFGTESTVEDTNEGSGNIAISSQNNFSLTDGTNTNTTLGAQTQATFVDDARPMLLTTSPANSGTGVTATASIVLTFSEAISGDATWTHTGGPAVTSFTETGTNVLTLAHSAYFSTGYHSIDVTAAGDAAGNTYNGAVAAIADPFSFTVTTSSTSSSSSTAAAATYDIDVTSPNGGEELTSGSTHDITWSSESSTTSMAFVNINLMYTLDGSTVQETIVSGTANDSSYAWTVPDIDTDSAMIQVVGTDLVEALATDTSDDYFTIGYPETSSDDSDEATDEDVTAPSSGTTGTSPVTGEVEEISVVAYGDYIRSAYFDTVYYVDMDDNGDLVRRPFMDAQTFMTWQNDWDDVATVTDATLPTIALGNPMLPKAGVVLVKIQSDARVFAIEGDGTIRWIATEDVAVAIYGADWADYVVDVSATLFPRFTQGDDIDGVESIDTDAMKTRDQVNA